MADKKTEPAFIRGRKVTMSQKYNDAGRRVVVTFVKAEPDQPFDAFQPGDAVKVTGWAKGKGFTGVMKRWGFKGGPRTHGQSDRERAPGSIGQGTDPGRVFLGKKMAGRMGGQRVTVSGLSIFSVDQEQSLVTVAGPVPGPRHGKIIIKKVNA